MTRQLLRSARAAIVLVLLQVSAASVVIPQAGTQHNDRVLQDALVHGISMGFPGISVAIGTDDRVAWAGAAGYSDVLRQIPVEINDRFGVGSITKTFVARVILQLVEEGKLDLVKTPVDYLQQSVIRRIPNTDTATLR